MEAKHRLKELEEFGETEKFVTNACARSPSGAPLTSNPCLALCSTMGGAGCDNNARCNCWRW